MAPSRAAAEREAALAATKQRGRRRARLAAAAWAAIAVEGAVRAFWTATGQPWLSLGLLAITVALALQLAAGAPAARWAAVIFTSARGMVGLQWAERVATPGARSYLLCISIAYLVLAAVLLFDSSIAHHCRRSRAPRSGAPTAP
ncbi:MAG: hypothetical protein IPN34_25760 [Planctomycetes bacterium]|nr:hypothetical protein [Planctomycetota bacterium]